MQHSSSDIIQNITDQGAGQLDYSYNNQSNDALFNENHYLTLK